MILPMHHHNERTFDPAKAARLDSPERREWLPPDAIVAALGLSAGQAVADIGAGTGYFSIPLARAVGGSGEVFAVDLQPEMLEILRTRIAEHRTGNVRPILGSAKGTTLRDRSTHLCFLANVWHELDQIPLVLAELRRVLVADGRVAVLDWRHDAAPPPGPPPEHRIAMEEVSRTLTSAGWAVQQEGPVGTYSYLVIAVQPQHADR
jgi:ubiquinone/menaquinone biosynthesis C-methylase UbiE